MLLQLVGVGECATVSFGHGLSVWTFFKCNPVFWKPGKQIVDNVYLYKKSYVSYIPEEMPRPDLAECNQIGGHFARGLPDL